LSGPYLGRIGPRRDRRPSARRPVSPTLGAAIVLLIGSVADGRAQTVADLQVMPEALELQVGQRRLVVASAYDRQGALIASAPIVYWASDTGVVRVSRDGGVTGLRPGSARVEARSAGKRAVVAVKVTASPAAPPPRPAPAAMLLLTPASIQLLPAEAMRLAARVAREDGADVALPPLTWRSLRPDVAAVDGDGIVIGVAPGETAIQGSGPGGLVATAPVTVAPARIAVPTARLALAPGDVDTLRVTVPSQGGRVVGGGLRWLSSDTSVAHVAPDGIVTARRSGTAEVVVVGLGQEGRVRVSVHRRPELFVVSPRPAEGALQLPAGGRVTLAARAQAADGTAIPEAEIAWEVSDSAAISIDPATGTLAGLRTGSATVTARLAGFESATWSVTVVPAGVALDRARVGLAVGSRTRLAARLVDDAGATVAGSAEVTWSSDRPDIASVGADGTVEGTGFGRATITAGTPWERRASADVFVVGDLVFASDRSGRGHGLHHLRTSRPETVGVLLADSGSNIQPAVSPDRTRIAFSSNRAGSFDLYVMDADGRNLTRLTTDAGQEGEPAWMPDGRRIFYSSAAGGTSRIVSVDADGGQPRAVVVAGASGAPAVSPDGALIAYASARDGSHDIYVADSAGGNERRITSTPEREAAPRFGPDGRLLYVVHRGARGSAVVRRSTDPAAAVETLAVSPDAILSLAVSPDGGTIAYVTGRITDRARNRSEYRLLVQPAVPGAAAVTVPTRPGEQVISPSF
jgi:uncharacterized protein YjdB